MPSPEPGQSWGILGGSFDPVHNGHITLANAAISAKQLTAVLFVPSVKHPFKKESASASFDDRLAMLRFTCEKQATFAVSDIEQSEKLSGYTIDTIQALQKKYPGTSFHFLIGADILSTLPKWHRIDELLNRIPFVAISRPEYDVSHAPAAFKNHIEIVQADTPDISSTEIRKLLKTRPSPEQLNALLPAPVIAYISIRGLYR